MKGDIPTIRDRVLAVLLAVGLVVPSLVSMPGVSAAAAKSTGATNEKSVIAGEMARACEGQRASLGDQWGEPADLDGDGQLDLILDHGGILCNGLRGNITCGFRACEVLIYLQRQGRLVMTYEILSIGYELAGGSPPAIKLVGHDFDEGVVRWDGRRFADIAPGAVTGTGGGAEGGTRSGIGPGGAGGSNGGGGPGTGAGAAGAGGPGPASPSVAAAPSTSSMAAKGEPGRGNGAALPRWQYGRHPMLGLTAHVESGDHAIGLACGQARYDATRSESVELRVTPSLVRQPSTVIVFQSGHAVGNILVDSGRGYHAVKNDVCMAGIADFRSQDGLMILPAGKIMSVVADGPVSKVEYALSDGTAVMLEGPGGMDRVPGTIRLPLAGSSVAIGKLIAACPAMRADIDNNCGI